MPGLTTLASAVLSKLGERKSVAALFEYDDKDNLTPNGLQFQYFPDSITDTKAVNYQTREIPGGSLPIYQWISSGERVISFVAFFSADVDFTQSTSFEKLGASGQQSRNVDIRTALLALRRYMFPRYANLGSASPTGVPLTLAPRKLSLVFSGSGLGLTGGLDDDANQNAGGAQPGQQQMDSVNVVMTQCDVTYEAFFPSGLPRFAQVQLAFAQIGQLGGVVTFPRVGSTTDSIVNFGMTDLGVAPYPLKVKWK